jgi:Mn-dependent DtxR family transcriptional regulator
MLEKLVKEIRNGGSLEINSLASRLGTSPQLVEAMLEHLQRSGLIRDYANCGVGCQGCGLQNSCKSLSVVRLWQSNYEG